MKLKVITNINQLSVEKWSSFVDKHPKGTFFHTLDYYTAFQSLENVSSHFVTLQNQSSQIVALSVFLIYKESGIKSYFSRRAISMGPVLVDNEDSGIEAFLLKELDKYLRGKAIYFELRNILPDGSTSSFYSLGYFANKHVNIKLDLNNSEEELYAAFSQSARNKIKRAESNLLEFRELDLEEDLNALYDLMNSVYARIKLPFLSKNDFESAVQKIHPNGRLWLVGVFHDTSLVSAMILTEYKHELYSWYLATSRKTREVGATDSLVWNILKLAKKKGVEVYNWGGAGYPSTPYGVRDFKRKFAGETYEDLRLIKVYNPFIYSLGKLYMSLFK